MPRNCNHVEVAGPSKIDGADLGGPLPDTEGRMRCSRDNGTAATLCFPPNRASGGYDRRTPEMARRRSGSTGGPFGRTTPRPCDSEFRSHWSLWLRHQEQQRGPRRRKGIGTAFRSWCSRIRPGWRDPCSKRRPDPFGTSAEAGATGDPWRWRGSAFEADACAQLVQKARVIAEYKRQFRCDRFQDAPPYPASQRDEG